MTDTKYSRLFAARQPIPPLDYDKASGVWIHTTDGRRYLDASSGLVCVNVGHAHPTVVQALTEQTACGTFASPGMLQPTHQAMLAERLTIATRRPSDRVVLTCSGTSGVEMAITMARLVQRARGENGRHRVLTASLGYHGNSALTLGLSGHRRRRPHPDDAMGLGPSFDPPYPGMHAAHPTRDCDATCTSEVATAIDAAGAEKVAAVLVEPINGTTGGGYIPPPGYLGALREVCRRRGVLLVHDEVLTGLGRTGRPLASQHWPDSAADIVVVSKGLGAGYVPISAVLVADEHGEQVESAGLRLPMMGTMSATPLQGAVGNAVLTVLEEIGALADEFPRDGLVRDAVVEATAGDSVVTDVRGAGFFYGLELPDGSLKSVLEAGKECGLLLYPFAGFRPDLSGEGVIVAPPLTILDSELEFMVGALRDTFARVSDLIAPT